MRRQKSISVESIPLSVVVLQSEDGVVVGNTRLQVKCNNRKLVRLFCWITLITSITETGETAEESTTTIVN